jgi:hypothetical protein
MSNENENTAPDEATQWHNERRADALRQVESRLNELSTGYDTLNQNWSALDEKENSAHESLDTRTLQAIWNERQRIQNDAQQIQQGWSAVQSEKSRLEQNADPRFEELLNGSSTKAQLFLRSHKHQLNDPAALRKLMFSDARARASGLTPDSNSYFKALEVAMGFENDRSLDDFKHEFDESANETKRSEPKEKEAKFRPSPEQLEMSRSLNGISQDEYLKACAKPFSDAANTVEVEPTNFESNSHKSLEVQLNEPAKKPAVDARKYRKLDPKTSVNLSPAELELISNMAVQTGQSVAELRKEFAINKLNLSQGKAGHYQLHHEKLRSEGRA